MVHVLAVSMPRSGHHLFEMILRGALQEQFDYCEFYEKDCCKLIPCNSKSHLTARTTGLFLQKSHDIDLIDPVGVPETYRIVQYRSPVPRSLSNYELHVRNIGKDDMRVFRNFLVEEALYFENFYKKWIENRSDEFFFLNYEELTADPLKACVAFFRFIDLSIDVEKISEGIAKTVGWRGRDNSMFTPAGVFSHRYARYPVLTNFEEIVIRHCPGYYPIRCFPSQPSSDQSLIGLLFNARKALAACEYDRAMELAKLACRQDPEDPMISLLIDETNRQRYQYVKTAEE